MRLRRKFRRLDLARATGFDFQLDFFRLFGLPTRYHLDGVVLEQRFHALQMQVHPDRYSHLSEPERRVSMQWATRVNEAYETLADPVARARYLLALRGVHTEEETNTAMPADFLLEQMEWREAIHEARTMRDTDALDGLEQRLRNDMHILQQRLADKIDVEHDYIVAASTVRMLKFLEKLADEIDSAYDQMDH